MKDCEDKASSFLIKLLNMLRSKQNAKTITWDSQYSGIRILNQQKLEEILLPRYFRHNRFASFVRQLNMYDFHKIYLPDNTSVFHHEIFNPRNKQSVFRIKRKATVPNDQNDEVIKNFNKIKSLFKSKELPQKRLQETNIIDNKAQDHKTKSSFKLLVKNSIGSLNDGKQVNSEQVLQEIISQIAPLKPSKELIKQKIKEFRKFGKFQSFLKRSSFINKIYAKLGIQTSGEDDNLSQLSIEEELMFDTKKSLTLRSLKMFESGPINLRDTLGMFLN